MIDAIGTDVKPLRAKGENTENINSAAGCMSCSRDPSTVPSVEDASVLNVSYVMSDSNDGSGTVHGCTCVPVEGFVGDRCLESPYRIGLVATTEDSMCHSFVK